MKKVSLIILLAALFGLNAFSQCGPPPSVGATAGATGATIFWSNVLPAHSFLVSVTGPTGFVGGGITTALSFNVGGLTGSTTYSVSVTPICGSTNQQGFPGFGAFTTLPTCPFNFEPNNSQGQAVSMTLNSPLFAGITPASDQDFYRYVLTDVSDVSVVLDNLPLDYDLQVLNSSGTVIGSSANSGTNTDAVNFTDQFPGTYYVRVYGYNGAFTNTACYRLTTSAKAKCDVIYEPNETSATASVISPYGSVKGLFPDGADIDWYQFNNPGTNDITITLNDLPADYDVILYNSSLSIVGSSAAGGTANETITAVNQPAGTYYVKVYPFNGASNPTKCYTLGVSLLKSCDNTPEPNDTQNEAYFLTVGGDAVIQSTIQNGFDIDWYRFVSSSSKNVTVTVSLTNLPADYDLQVFRYPNTLIGSSTNFGTSNESVSFMPTAPDLYYAKVFSKSGASSDICYRLTIKQVSGGLTAPVSNTEEVLDPQVVVTHPLLTGNDMQVTAFPNPASTRLSVQVVSPGTERIMYSLLNASGNVMVQREMSTVKGKNQVTLDVSAYTKGIYLLRVQQGSRVVTQKVTIL
jgi:Secretion system C-terminal sorting domain/Bacterial pre-peptidase C-terminal domain